MLEGLLSKKICSKLEAIKVPIANTNSIFTVGMMQGKVIDHILRSLDAPSMSAASYNCGSMAVIAAR